MGYAHLKHYKRALFAAVVFRLILFLCNVANALTFVQRSFEIVQKSGSREHGDIIISTRMYAYTSLRARASPETSTCEVLCACDVARKLQLTLYVIMAS